MHAKEKTLPIIMTLLCILLQWFAGNDKALSAMPSAERILLPNQLVILVSEDHSLSFVTFQLLLDAGSWRDPEGKEGLANLTAEGIVLGASEHTLSEINEALDFAGAVLDSSCGRDFSTLTLKTLRRNMQEGIDLFLETLTRPAFPSEEVRRTRQIVLGRIRTQQDDPGEVAEKAFRKALYSDSPYGHAMEGDETSLSSIREGDLRAFYETYYRPNIAVLAVVGDITMEEVNAKVVPGLSAWKEREIPETPFKVAFPEAPGTIRIQMPITQANIVLGHGGIKRIDPDYYALSVMNHLLGGGGLGSRLLENIRIGRGLAYSVNSAFVAGRRSGSFQIRLQTKNASAGEAVSLALGEMKRMQEEPVGERELETAKKYLIGSFPLHLVTQGGRAAFFLQAEYFGLGLDYGERYPALIGAVTAPKVQDAARTYLHPKRALLCIVGDQKEIEIQGEK